MYESHFGITRSPFQLTPDPWFYFDSRGHHHAIAALRQGCGPGQAFVVLSGEIGSGKSMLVRTRLDEFDGKAVVGYLASTQLNSDGLRQAVAAAFGVPLVEKPVAAWEQEFAQLLASLQADGRRAVLIIDEAQHLDAQGVAMLEALAPRLPQALPPLEVWLVGQPELRNLVAGPGLSAFRKRVGVSCHLGPLEPAETQAYIEHRLRKVGWNGLPSFEGGAFEVIHRSTGGLPRLINRLCNRLLLGCFLSSDTLIEAETVARAATELQMEIEGREDLGLMGRLAEQAVDGGGTGDLSAADLAPPASGSAPAGPGPEHPTTGTPAPTDRLLCVAGGHGDHVRAAALMDALARSPQPLACTLVSAYRNDALRLHRPLFEGLDRPGACVELDVTASAPALRTAEVTERFERLMARCRPCGVVVFAGSELALACAVVANKLGVPVAHVGAGVRLLERTRTGDLTRTLTDRLAAVLYTADEAARRNLALDGIGAERIHHAGNLTADALVLARNRAAQAAAAVPSSAATLPQDRRGYGLVVLNRAANVERRERLSELVQSLRQARRDLPLVWTLGRRTEQRLRDFGLSRAVASEGIVCTPLRTYPDFLALLSEATCVLSDSRCVNDEALALGVPCLGFFDPADRECGAGAVAVLEVGADPKRVTRALWSVLYGGAPSCAAPADWDGLACRRIAAHLTAWLRARAGATSPPQTWGSDVAQIETSSRRMTCG